LLKRFHDPEIFYIDVILTNDILKFVVFHLSLSYPSLGTSKGLSVGVFVDGR
jgi:hypothetical protein